MRIFKRKPKKPPIPKEAVTMGYYDAMRQIYNNAARATIEEILKYMKEEKDSDV